MQKVTTFLWFDKEAEKAARFYVSVFPNSKVTNTTPMIVNFTLDGQEFIALNGGPKFKFNESISFFVSCEDQKEVDYYWKKLSANLKDEQCGWLKDKYGLSWQIIPKQLGELMGDKDRDKANRVMSAMLKMKKIEIKALEKAYKG